MITADQIVAHLVGDYILQSDWMASEKTKKSVAAAAHALVYTLPFLFITQNLAALTFICLTHLLIDRFRLARYVCWLKNCLGPRRTLAAEQIHTSQTDLVDGVVYQRWWHPWSECSVTGYHKDRPAWMATWLLIIADNTIHILMNGLAIMVVSGV